MAEKETAEKEFDVLCCRCGTVVRHYTRVFVDRHRRMICVGFCLRCMKNGRLVLTGAQLEKICRQGVATMHNDAGVGATGVNV